MELTKRLKCVACSALTRPSLKPVPEKDQELLDDKMFRIARWINQKAKKEFDGLHAAARPGLPVSKYYTQGSGLWKVFTLPGDSGIPV
jgi:hypothetical protein